MQSEAEKTPHVADVAFDCGGVYAVRISVGHPAGAGRRRANGGRGPADRARTRFPSSRSAAGKLQGADGPHSRRGFRDAPDLVRRRFTRIRKISSCKIPSVPEEFLKMHPEIILPPEQMQGLAGQRGPAPSSDGRTAERFHWKIGDKVPIQSTIWAKEDGSRTWTFDIVGIFDGKDKGTDTTPLFFRYDYFDEARRGRQRTGRLVSPSASRIRRRRRKWRNGWTRNLKIHRRKPRPSRKARSSRPGPARSATSSSSSRRF